MPINKKIILFSFAFLVGLTTFSQNALPGAKPVDKGFMVSQGKIYVVMVIVITILLGLLAYVLRLDRKITKLEKGEGL
jgi:hypothetical protein